MTERLNTLLEKSEITYDLLWALFKLNAMIYTTCVGSDKPSCVEYDFGEQKKAINGVEYFHLGCRYLDLDSGGKVFGEFSTTLRIRKFRGKKKINSLGAFPLMYQEKVTKAYLETCGRKFLKLVDVHHF
jgi:hypothetical protein